METNCFQANIEEKSLYFLKEDMLWNTERTDKKEYN